MALNRYDPATAIPILEERIRSIAEGTVSRRDIEKIIEETKQLMYRLDIYATNGNLLYEDNKTTTLVAEITSWDVDITSDFPENLFKWKRVSGNAEADATWNAAHEAGRKKIELTVEDVGTQSTFYCSVGDNEKIDVEASILVMSTNELERTVAWVKSMNPFVHIRYSMNANGVPYFKSPTEMSESPIYMGNARTDSAVAPEDASAYTWTKIKGAGIKSRKPQYYKSMSEKECSGGEWSNEMPEWESGKWIWIRDFSELDDGTITYSTPILARALNQANAKVAEVSTGLNRLETETSTAITGISTVIEDEKGRIDALITRAESTDLSITEMQGDVQAARTNISNLTERTSSLQTNLDDITTRVGAAETNITNINGDIETVTERVAAAEQEVTKDAIVNKVSDTFATKVEVDGKVSGEDFDAIVETINRQISDVDIRADSIETSVSKTEETVSGLASKTEEISSKVDQTVQSVDTRFTTLSKVVTEQGTQIAEQETLIRSSGDGIEIGKSGQNTKMQLDNDSLDFKVNGETVAEYGADGLGTKSVKAERQVTVKGEWAIRPGALITGKGNNLDIQWIKG